MDDVKILEKPKKICVFLGSGFDKNIGMPTWSNLIDEYSSFLVGNIDKRRVEGLSKIEFIKKSELSILRRYGMLNSLDKEHRKDYEENPDKFIEMVFNVNSYDLKNIEILEKFKITIRKMQNIRIITTNISNTLEELGFQSVDRASDLVDSKNFFPIHGMIKNGKKRPVLSEIQYLENKDAYHQLSLSLSEYDEMHIIGYSLSDFNVLDIIKNSEINKIYFYFLYDDENWKEIFENHINEFFNLNINFRSIKTDWSIEKNNQLTEDLIQELKVRGTPFGVIEKFRNFMEVEDE